MWLLIYEPMPVCVSVKVALRRQDEDIKDFDSICCGVFTEILPVVILYFYVTDAVSFSKSGFSR